jgi:hypothetical protein
MHKALVKSNENTSGRVAANRRASPEVIDAAHENVVPEIMRAI